MVRTLPEVKQGKEYSSRFLEYLKKAIGNSYPEEDFINNKIDKKDLENSSLREIIVVLERKTE